VDCPVEDDVEELEIVVHSAQLFLRYRTIEEAKATIEASIG
jgi:hypothetical protein